MSEASSWAGRSVLVTGAGGFIGSHLAEELARAGAGVRAFVRYTSRGQHGWLEEADPEVADAIEVFRGDLANPEAVAGAVRGCEVVLHLGALIPIPYSYRHPREFVSANVEGTLNVLEAARREGPARIVHTSTSEVYGTAQTVPITEEHPLHPQSPYAATKVAADQLALSFHRSFDLDVVVVRPFNTFGPRQSARAIVPTIVTQALGRDRIELGALGPTRDMLYVGDTVRGMMAAALAKEGNGQVINLGTGREVTIGELAERTLALVGREVPIVSTQERTRPPTSEVERLVADTTRATELLGWEPQMDLDTGLRDTIDWIRGALPTYKVDIYNV
jgi:NAD dependent epimerase/dehydratase